MLAYRFALFNALLLPCVTCFRSLDWKQSTVTATRLSATALILQNKGGGHGELGYQLAQTLETKDTITSITILQDEACKDSSEPFKSYPTDLPHVKVIRAPLSDATLTASALQSLLGEGVSFEYVWDNASKGADGAGQACVDCAKGWDALQLYAYVSSAGVYKPAKDATFPMTEGTPVKDSAGQVGLEQYAVQQGLPFVSFRPQYIYGIKANKHDYLDYFFDRIVRGLPVPIPGDGTQCVSLTNSRDVAALLASPVGHEAAAVAQGIFNCGTDVFYTYNDVATLCAKVTGMDVTIEHYEAELFGKTNFPFRDTNFYVDPSKAKEVLGWSGSACNLETDLGWYYEDYKKRGGPDKKMTNLLVKDWEIVVGCKTAPPDYVRSIYDKYDPLIIDTSKVKN